MEGRYDVNMARRGWKARKIASCVEYIMVPLGLAIPMGRVVGRLLITAAVMVHKCAVLPESAIARASGGIMVGGGPMGTVARLKPESLLTLDWIVVSARQLRTIGSPRRQFAGEDERREEERVAVELSEVGRRRARPEEMILLPPIMRNAVAVS